MKVSKVQDGNTQRDAEKRITKLTLVKRSKNQKNQHISRAELYKNNRIFSNSESRS